MSEFILIAEDEENDRMLLERAFKKFPIPTPIHIVPTGEGIVHYLTGVAPYTDRIKFPFPTAILLDLKMPRMGGFDVLEWLQENGAASVVPIIVWSSSDQAQDIVRAYRLGANCFIVKPPSLKEIESLLTLTFQFWSRCAKPPPPPQLILKA